MNIMKINGVGLVGDGEVLLSKLCNQFVEDYGNSTNKSIRNAIDNKIKEGKLKIHKKIGEDVGYKTKSGWEMDDREGVICNIGDRI